MAKQKKTEPTESTVEKDRVQRLARVRFIAEKCAESLESLSYSQTDMSPFQRAVDWYRALILDHLGSTATAVAAQVAEIKEAEKEQRPWTNLLGIIKPKWAGWRRTDREGTYSLCPE